MADDMVLNGLAGKKIKFPSSVLPLPLLPLVN